MVEQLWQTIVIGLLRLGIQAAISLGHSSSEDLDALFKVAKYREGKQHASTNRGIAVLMGKDEDTVRRWRDLSEEIAEDTTQHGVVARVLKQLQKGPLTRQELERLVPINNVINTTEVTLQLLRDLEILDSDDDKGPWQLSNNWRIRPLEEWRAGLKEADLLEASMSHVAALVSQEKLTASQLMRHNHLQDFPKAVITRAITWLERGNHIRLEEKSGGIGQRRKYVNGEVPFFLTFTNPSLKVPASLPIQIRHIAYFLEHVLAKRSTWFGSKFYIFNALESDLPDFGKRHRKWVEDEMTWLEARAEHPEYLGSAESDKNQGNTQDHQAEASARVVPVSIQWTITPLATKIPSDGED